jgi:hypothetical protein
LRNVSGPSILSGNARPIDVTRGDACRASAGRRSRIRANGPKRYTTARATGGLRESTAAVHFGDWLLVPNLGEPIEAHTELAFAFVDGAGLGAHLKAAASILSGGRSIGGAPIELPSPGADGRIAYVGRMPLPLLEAGTYQLAVTISEAKRAVQRLAAFRIANQ